LFFDFISFLLELSCFETGKMEVKPEFKKVAILFWDYLYLDGERPVCFLKKRLK